MSVQIDDHGARPLAGPFIPPSYTSTRPSGSGNRGRSRRFFGSKRASGAGRRGAGWRGPIPCRWPSAIALASTCTPNPCPRPIDWTTQIELRDGRSPRVDAGRRIGGRLIGAGVVDGELEANLKTRGGVAGRLGLDLEPHPRIAARIVDGAGPVAGRTRRRLHA